MHAEGESIIAVAIGDDGLPVGVFERHNLSPRKCAAAPVTHQQHLDSFRLTELRTFREHQQQKQQRRQQEQEATVLVSEPSASSQPHLSNAKVGASIARQGATEADAKQLQSMQSVQSAQSMQSVHSMQSSISLQRGPGMLTAGQQSVTNAVQSGTAPMQVRIAAQDSGVAAVCSETPPPQLSSSVLHQDSGALRLDNSVLSFGSSRLQMGSNAGWQATAGAVVQGMFRTSSKQAEVSLQPPPSLRSTKGCCSPQLSTPSPAFSIPTTVSASASPAFAIPTKASAAKQPQSLKPTVDAEPSKAFSAKSQTWTHGQSTAEVRCTQYLCENILFRLDSLLAPCWPRGL